MKTAIVRQCPLALQYRKVYKYGSTHSTSVTARISTSLRSYTSRAYCPTYLTVPSNHPLHHVHYFADTPLSSLITLHSRCCLQVTLCSPTTLPPSARPRTLTRRHSHPQTRRNRNIRLRSQRRSVQHTTLLSVAIADIAVRTHPIAHSDNHRSPHFDPRLYVPPDFSNAIKNSAQPTYRFPRCFA